MLLKSGITAAIAAALLGQVALAQTSAPGHSPATDQASRPAQPPQAKPASRSQIEKAATRAIGMNWYPPKCNPCPPSAVIRIKVDEQGGVREKQMVQSSGVSIFDQAAMNAIKDQPKAFPPLWSAYPGGSLEVVFDGNIYHANAVTLRAASTGDQSGNKNKQSGDGTARITGKVVGARTKPIEEDSAK
ncbi:MAG: TonB family protein [Candidatus Obscuribacterales bacterium]